MHGMGASVPAAARSVTRNMPGTGVFVPAVVRSAIRVTSGMAVSVRSVGRKTTIMKKLKRTNIHLHAATAQAIPALAQTAEPGVTAIQAPDTVMSVCAAADVERWKNVERDQKRKNEKMTAEDITQLINDITSDQKRVKEIAVLPIMCGSGKSTAISYLIRQTIENTSLTGNGLLVVTDSIDRLDDYMHPHDNTLHSFLDEHDDQVCIMTHENIEKAHKTQYDKPVLMMTTQRYFRLTVAEINHYLKWNSGTRPLVIIDEFPELMTLVELDAKKLAECDAAVRASDKEGFRIPGRTELDYLNKYFDRFVSGIRKGECGKQDSLLCFWSFQTEENLKEYYGLLNFWENDYEDIYERRTLINNYGGGTYYDDIFARYSAIRQLKSSFALISQRKINDDRFYDSMLFLLDNYKLIHDVNAKNVIILDGTADLSPEYFPDRFCINNSPDFKRPLNHLQIKLINYPTGKTALLSSKEKQAQLLDYVEAYVSEIKDSEGDLSTDKWAFFTYMALEKAFKRRFNNNNVEHFGNIKGKNDFRAARHIFQVGINRYPDEVYYLLYRARYSDKVKKYRNMEEAYNEVLAQSDEIKAEIRNLKGETREIMNRLLLAEIEQNFFRGIIRNSDTEDDFTFHLFLNANNYMDLIKMMKDRYEPLGAKIVLVEKSVVRSLLRIMARNENTYAKRFIEWHDNGLRKGEEYTPSIIREKIGMTNVAAVQSYQLMLHNNPVIRFLLGEEKIHRGTYIKLENWHYKTQKI